MRYDAKSQQFLPYLSGISAIHLAFSKDGQWVAYSSFPDATLWRSKIDGTEKLQLTSSPMIALRPQWSPDGKQIAFSASTPSERRHIYIVSADGGVPKKVTNGERNEDFPNWSQDGNSLFFGKSRIDLPSVIYRLDLRTNRLTMLSGSEGMWVPRLSPDNNYIAALNAPTGHLMLFDMKAQKWTELSQTFGLFPTWSHDGNYVCFLATVGNEPAFYRVHIKDRKLERVVSLKDVKRASESMASWTGLAPDGSPLALRDISSDEIYALDWQLP